MPLNSHSPIPLYQQLEDHLRAQIAGKVYPVGARNSKPMQPGPYTFADSQQATAFVTEAVEALMYLGCEVQAQ